MSQHDLPLFALDFKTTGLDPHLDQVVEIGLVGPCPRPGIEEEGIQGLMGALGEGPVRVVCHNAPFERGFLEAWARRSGRKLPEIRWVCTRALARELTTDASLSSTQTKLAWLLGLDHGPLHRAQADAELTLRLHETLQSWAAVKTALGGRDPLVYLAGPLRGDGTAEQIRHNQTRMLLQARWAQMVLPEAALAVPHTNFAFLDESRDRNGEVRRQALRSCEKLLSRCDAMILCGRELSPGMEQEKRLADRLEIPTLQVPGWDGPRSAAADREGAA